jgi:hypothetical protein
LFHDQTDFGSEKISVIFAPRTMKPTNNIYSKALRVRSVAMILLLLLLTISPALLVPNIHTHQQTCVVSCPEHGHPYNADDTSPVEESKEGKSQNAPTVTEEFLHEHPVAAHADGMDTKSHKNEHSRIYIAYHGDLPVPPPRYC